MTESPFQPAFASLSMLPSYIAPSAWWEHVPVAHWLIAQLRPRSVVELGTHFGVSFFAFCEAAAQFSPETFVYAIDTWEGDEHAGSYGDSVYTQVFSHLKERHAQRGQLIRSTFDDACSYFESASIDLLHIDGLHTYEAVRHDFETWMPKLRQGGTLLLHDINVRERQFGVWTLWNELQADSAFQCMELLNGHGLGIATLSKVPCEWHHRFREMASTLSAKGSLLDQVAQLKPEGHGTMTRQRPFRLQAELAQAEVARLEHENAQLHMQLEGCQSHEIELEASLQKFLRSHSWRVTRPLRGVSRSIKALLLRE